jgi:outer membrane protein assembly factor BamB
LWTVDLGEGHAAPVIDQGRVFLMDYDEAEKADILRCFSLETGVEIWRRGYFIHVKRNHGMSRTIPAVHQNYVVSMGPRCHVMCVSADSGQVKWGLDLEKTYSTEVPLWYTGQCPLIDDSVAVIAPGGSALMIGVHCETGEVLWETPNPDQWKMSHSSIMPMTLHGKKMYVYSAIGGLIGVSAEGADVGRMLWKTNQWNHTVIAPSPLALGENRFFMTAGYGAGGMLVQVHRANDQFNVEILRQYKPKDGFASEQQTPILFEGHMFGILPKDAGSLRNQFVCVQADDPQNILWSSGKTHRFGLGPFIIADGKFYILSDEGELSVAEASTSSFKLLSVKKIFDGHDAWGPISLVNGHMLLRDSKRMFCLDMTKR